MNKELLTVKDNDFVFTYMYVHKEQPITKISARKICLGPVIQTIITVIEVGFVF